MMRPYCVKTLFLGEGLVQWKKEIGESMIKVNFEPEVDVARTAEILKEIAKDKMGGWYNLPRKFDMGELVRIKEAAKKIQGFKLNAQQINGIDRKTCGAVKLHAMGRTGVNFLEVMACPGGCQNGPCSLA